MVRAADLAGKETEGIHDPRLTPDLDALRSRNHQLVCAIFGAGHGAAPGGALASRASPVTGYYPAQPPRCDIVAVLTAMM